jgi:hypothetical protein
MRNNYADRDAEPKFANSGATPKKKSVLELAKENGFDLSRVRDQREIVDAMTGKRKLDASKVSIEIAETA